jgi:hypothetical protein
VNKLSNNKLIGGLALLLVGIALIIISLFHHSEPTCNNQVMKPDDLCIVGGKAVSYEARKAETGGTNSLQLYLGIGGVVLGGGLLVLYVVRDLRRATPVPPTSTE